MNRRTLVRSANLSTLARGNQQNEIMALPSWFKYSKVSPAIVRDHTNQLDLFSTLAVEPLPQVETANADSPPQGDSHARTRPAKQLDFASLGEALPGSSGGVEVAEEPRISTGSHEQSGHGRSVPPRISAEGPAPSGLGIDVERSVPARKIIAVDEPERGPSRDFRITEALHIGEGSLRRKAAGNLSAIRTLKQTEAEKREATASEKEILARYVGWGAMAQAFEHWPGPEWQAVAEELKRDLTPEEYESARASTPNAHFTSPMVIRAVWDGMERLGMRKDARILEPAMGVGHFLGLKPSDAEGHCTGVELDSITARIAQKLYPDSTIFAKGLEETPLPDNYFDAVVGNVPFGNYAVHDPAMDRRFTRAVHDYFFAKSLDKTRAGGLMALITSRYTMDKQDDSIRKHLSEKADLVGAVRLPNTAFKGNAGTDVTTDILFLRKRRPGEQPAGETWQHLENVDSPDGPTAVNEYFAHHPQMMLGTLALKGTMYRGAEPTLNGVLTPELLRKAIMTLPEGAYIPKDEQRGPPAKILDAESFAGIKDGAYAERDGAIIIRTGSRFEPTTLSAASASRVRGLMALRDTVRTVFTTQLEDAPETEIAAARRSLNRQYDAFVSTHGPVSTKENIRAFAGDPDHPLLLSLENYDAESKTAKKTAIFDKRTLERYKPKDHVDTASEALAISLNETGGVNWKRMTDLTGHPARELQQELDSLIYKNPEGEWEIADRYLSGDVRAKLKTAESAVTLDKQYQRNVGALKAVQPADLLPGDISARLGSSWIPASDVKSFICETLDIPQSLVNVTHAGSIATWALTLDSHAKQAVSNTTQWGTPRAYASELIDDALNGRTPTIYDLLPDDKRVVNQLETIAAREAQQKLKDKFSEWIWQDEERAERLAHVYNEKFNNLRLRTYDGSHLTFPGMNRSILREGDLDKHQKDAVWRTVQNENTLLAHCVGAGKTYEMVASAMEMKRLGLANKPMIVVPNHLVDQWASAFMQLYPHAHIFVAGKDQFSTGNRQKAMSRIATGNYDAVIVSHKSFELLPVSDETFKHFVDKQIDQLEAAVYEVKADKGDNRRIVKELEKAKKRLEAKLKERADREKKDDAVTFEQLGVDRIFVDESDLFKNLGFVSKMNRIAGLPNSESNRALDMFMKTQYLGERNGGTVFATGTPVSNTMAEMYTLMRYLAPDLLAAAGVEHFDAWAANFGEAVTSLELSPDGSGYRMHTRFSKFVNLPELLSMFRTFADVQTADMLNLPRPELEGGKPQISASAATPELKDFVSTLVARAQKLRNGGVDPRTDNMLKITGDGRKAALDMRLVDPNVEIHTETKVRKAVSNIFRTWEQSKSTRAIQLVFCDLSTPNPDKFNVYDEVRSELMTRGVPANEIAFIHDADTDAQKKALFDSVNSGRIRILIGSTEKMGAGTNVQKRLKALHHLDAPWRPRDIEQCEGRILRQGNENASVSVHRYVTEGSFDAYMWQTLETKARFIQQIMNGSVTVRQAEDLEGGALTFAEIKAIASGNPAVMEKVKVDTEVRKLDQLRSSHINQQHNIKWQIKSLPDRIKRDKDYLSALSSDMATRDDHAEEDFSILVGKRTYAGKGAREAGAAALVDVITSWSRDETLKVRANYRGFEILSKGSHIKDFAPDIFIRGKGTYEAHLNAVNPAGTIQSIESVLRGLDRRAEEERREIERGEKAFTDFKAQLNKTFEHEERLKDLLRQQAQLNASLDLDKHDTQVVSEAPEEETKQTPSSFAARVGSEPRGAIAAL